MNSNERLQSLMLVFTALVTVLIAWTVHDLYAGPVLRGDGHVLAGAADSLVDRAVPALSTGSQSRLTVERTLDAVVGLVIGVRLSDHEQMLRSAVPSLGMRQPYVSSPRVVDEEDSVPVVIDGGDEEPDDPDDPDEPEGEQEAEQDQEPTGDKPVVLVYHAHAREAYMPEELRTGQVRFSDTHSDDLSITVVAVGEQLAAELNRLGVVSVQSRVVHDREGRLGAYQHAERTLSSNMLEYPGLAVLLDIHRDAQRRPLTTVNVEGNYMARVLIVLGQDNEHWRQNYEFACRFLDRLEEYAPGISRGILPKASRYNQHFSPGALLVEIGGPENSVDEAVATAKLIARVISDMFASGDIPPYDAATLGSR